MISLQETVISIVSSSSDQRLVLAIRDFRDKPIILRTESFSPDVGWFTQQELELTRAELQGLKSVLGVKAARACEQAVAASESCQHSRERILSFAEARSRRA